MRRIRRQALLCALCLLLGGRVGLAEPSAADGLKGRATSPSDYWKAGQDRYRQGHWSEFFGLSAFVRRELPDSPQAEKFRLLEILALLRHCRFDLARAVWAGGRGGKTPQWQRLAPPLEALLAIAPAYPDSHAPTDATVGMSGISALANLWPVRRSALLQVDPYLLRRRVTSQCRVDSQCGATSQCEEKEEDATESP
jgi:hypothetical protein